jgi:hypothetical protein
MMGVFTAIGVIAIERVSARRSRARIRCVLAVVIALLGLLASAGSALADGGWIR